MFGVGDALGAGDQRHVLLEDRARVGFGVRQVAGNACVVVPEPGSGRGHRQRPFGVEAHAVALGLVEGARTDALFPRRYSPRRVDEALRPAEQRFQLFQQVVGDGELGLEQLGVAGHGGEQCAPHAAIGAAVELDQIAQHFVGGAAAGAHLRPSVDRPEAHVASGVA